MQEDEAIKYEPLDSGEFQFVINEYNGSAHYVTRKNLQDSFYMSRLQAEFVNKERRALMEVLETDILKTPTPSATQGGQTVSIPNVINRFDHRYFGTGSTDTIAVQDFAYAKLALKKANVPLSSLIAIVDPTVGYEIETLTNLTNVSNNPHFEGIVSTGITTGMRFIKNVYGFDVFESNYLAVLAAGEAITGGSGAHGDSANQSALRCVQNLFFSVDPSVKPIVGAWRQLPTVDAEFNKDFQREEYVTTARYGLKLFRPENMVVVITDTTQV